MLHLKKGEAVSFMFLKFQAKMKLNSNISGIWNSRQFMMGASENNIRAASADEVQSHNKNRTIKMFGVRQIIP